MTISTKLVRGPLATSGKLSAGSRKATGKCTRFSGLLARGAIFFARACCYRARPARCRPRSLLGQSFQHSSSVWDKNTRGQRFFPVVLHPGKSRSTEKLGAHSRRGATLDNFLGSRSRSQAPSPSVSRWLAIIAS